MAIDGKRLFFNLKRTLPNTRAKDFLHVVENVQTYKEFLPYCYESTMSKYRVNGGKKVGQGTLHIGFGPITDKYTSRVTVIPEDQVITATNQDGHVFRELKSRWKFSENEKGECVYEFNCRYIMGNPLYSSVAKAVFGKVSEQMADSFEKRVAEVGKKRL